MYIAYIIRRENVTYFIGMYNIQIIFVNVACFVLFSYAATLLLFKVNLPSNGMSNLPTFV